MYRTSFVPSALSVVIEALAMLAVLVKATKRRSTVKERRKLMMMMMRVTASSTMMRRKMTTMKMIKIGVRLVLYVGRD